MTENEQLLFRHFDGELAPDEAESFAKELANSEALTEELGWLEEGQLLLKEHIEAAVSAADFSGFFDRVAEGIGEFSPASASTAQSAPPAQSTAGERIKAWWAQYWTPVLVSVAAAAAVAFVVGRPSATGSKFAPDPVVAAGPVTVDSVRNEGNKTVLISQPVEAEGATVIWLLDDEEVEDDNSPMPGEDPI